jgi:histone deacetylase 1/2
MLIVALLCYDIFLQFQKHVEHLLNRKIVHVQSDWGGEYEKLHPFFHGLGISHRVSCPHTHQQNSTAERKHRHIVETGLTLLAHVSVPLSYWNDASSLLSADQFMDTTYAPS